MTQEEMIMSETAKIYDKSYYDKMRGDGAHDIYRRIADQFKIDFSGKRVLDVGCGRGEMLSQALLEGARHVVGCDISPAAIALSESRLKSLGFAEDMYRLVVLKEDDFLKSIDGPFDIILMLDFVEHVSAETLQEFLVAAKCLLSPQSGNLLIHTFPNLFWHKILMFILTILSKEKRREIESIHVNVQTPSRLMREFRRAGFTEYIVWVESDFIYSSSFYKNMQDGFIKKISKLLFNDIVASTTVRRMVGMLGLEQVVYMSIYGRVSK